ncbi:MAG TPA: MrtC family glutamic-type intramembrane protease [Polyangiaceae bacterium]
MDVARRRALVEALVASALVTALVTAASAFLPEHYIATGVGFVFLGATWLLVWRRDDTVVLHSGLSFGGLVLPGTFDARATARSALRALAWALGFAAVTFIPFFFGWRAWWGADGHFSFTPHARELASDVAGQVVIIALPEEAFYRGYLQTRLDDVWLGRFRVAGAPIGLGLFVTSAIFALGHLATIHAATRLAVFFPSLLFGWLRARTGGIGASLTFHALCNLFSEALGRGYGAY